MQFENYVFGMHDKALKLLIKKKDSHLSISAESFDTALEILSGEYLNERCLIEQIFVTIDTARLIRVKDASLSEIFLLR